jgi:hypothetical protein
MSAVLQGHDIKPVHCLFNNNQGEIILFPQPGASVTVNDRRTDQPVRLSQGHLNTSLLSPVDDRFASRESCSVVLSCIVQPRSSKLFLVQGCISTSSFQFYISTISFVQ